MTGREQENIIPSVSYGIEKANAYVIVSAIHVLVSDDCFKEVARELKIDIIPDYLILTHERYDHIWDISIIRIAFPEIGVVAHKYCNKAFDDAKQKRRSNIIYFALRFGEKFQNEKARNRKDSVLTSGDGL